MSCLQFSVCFPCSIVHDCNILIPTTGCWASSGYTTQGCAALEQQLRACMDAPVRFAISTNQPSPQLTLTLSSRKHNKTRRAPSTTTFRDYIPRLSALTRGNRRQPPFSHCIAPLHCLYHIMSLYHYPVLVYNLLSPDTLRGVWFGMRAKEAAKAYWCTN